MNYVYEGLQGLGLSDNAARFTTLGGGILLVGVLAWLANLVAKQIILRLVTYLVGRTITKWDDKFVERNVFGRLSHLAPAIVIYLVLPLVIGDYPTVTAGAIKLTQIYMIVVGLLALHGLLSASNDIYQTFETSKQIPLTSFIQVLKEYLQKKQAEVVGHNKQHQVDDASPVNGRRLTNVGTFRAYIEAYLRAHPKIRKDMTFLVRQHEPGRHGLPLQIYVFTDTTVGPNTRGFSLTCSTMCWPPCPSSACALSRTSPT